MTEKYLRTALEQSPLGTLIFRPDGSALLSNTAWKKLWSFGKDGNPEDMNVFEDTQIRAAGLVPYIEESMVGGAVITPPLLYDPARVGGRGLGTGSELSSILSGTRLEPYPR